MLSFYRNVIRTARAKDPELRAQILQYARLEMEKHRHIERRNVLLVEHYLRKGMKQLEIVQSGNVQVSSPVRLATSESLLLPRARSDHSICRGLAFSRAHGLGRERGRGTRWGGGGRELGTMPGGTLRRVENESCAM